MNRSPAAAGVLSVVFPGLGHLYGGAAHRAVALAAVFVALLQAAIHNAGLIVLALPAVWLFAIVDAVRVAEESARAHDEGRTAEFRLDRNWAVGLVAAGVICTFAVIPGFEFVARLWPLALVGIGVQMLRGRPVVPRFGAGAAAPPPRVAQTPPPPPAAATAAGTPTVTADAVPEPASGPSHEESAGKTATEGPGAAGAGGR